MRRIVIEIRYDIDAQEQFGYPWHERDEVKLRREYALHQDITEHVFANLRSLVAPHGARVQGATVRWPEDCE